MVFRCQLGAAVGSAGTCKCGFGKAIPFDRVGGGFYGTEKDEFRCVRLQEEVENLFSQAQVDIEILLFRSRIARIVGFAGKVNDGICLSTFET